MSYTRKELAIAWYYANGVSMPNIGRLMQPRFKLGTKSNRQTTSKTIKHIGDREAQNNNNLMDHGRWNPKKVNRLIEANIPDPQAFIDSLLFTKEEMKNMSATERFNIKLNGNEVPNERDPEVSAPTNPPPSSTSHQGSGGIPSADYRGDQGAGIQTTYGGYGGAPSAGYTNQPDYELSTGERVPRDPSDRPHHMTTYTSGGYGPGGGSGGYGESSNPPNPSGGPSTPPPPPSGPRTNARDELLHPPVPSQPYTYPYGWGPH